MTPTERLIELLEAEGFTQVRVRANLGYWSHRHQDVCRWEGWAVRPSDGKEVSFMGWNTITDCARRGIGSLDDFKGDLHIEVFANPRKSKRPATPPEHTP